MKRFVTVILSILYISTSTGATLHMHYCMGKLTDWALRNNDSDLCGSCGMEKKENKGCCKDEHKFIKNVTDQKITEAGFQLTQLVAATLPVSFVEIAANDFSSVTEENPISHAPPRSSGVATYVRNCVFLI